MINDKNTIPSQASMFIDFLESKTSIEKSHSDITSSFDGVNALYGESSVVEDIILNEYLYLYSAAKQISPENAKSNFVTESFLAQNFLDPSFPVDNKLNIDMQNGDLTLPIISTTNVKIDSVIIESDSNGSIGDSENNNQNSDISVITQGSSTSLFIYDKIVNSLSMSTLYLSATIKFKESTISNGLYIQLYSDTSAGYPNIDLVQGSEDGVEWFDIASEFKIKELSNINKADYYIRFESKLTRFIRVRFSQDNYSPISTGFGTRYRYMIGVRQITPKQTVYSTTGEYISIPFSNKQALSYVKLVKEDSGNSKYFISANNGTVWQELTPGEVLYLYNNILGLRDGVDINNIRLRILMDKKSISINQNVAIEYAVINDNGSYYLKDKPINMKVGIGNHISFGNLQSYTIQTSDIKQVPLGILEDDIDMDYTATIYFVPYKDTLQDELVLKLNGARVKNDTTIYSFLPHQDPNHTTIIFKNKDLTSTSGVLSLNYKPVAMVTGQQEVTLQYEPFIVNLNAFLLEEVSGQNKRTLKLSEYTVNGNKIRINDSSFNPEYTYNISYYPTVDITEVVDKVDSNKVEINNIKTSNSSKLKFSYTVSDEANATDLMYYTPICNQYILELR